ncbi:hypothetical protein [Pedobacter rhodius]|uniref:Uncharacterized protein n=1 Tax=Pedobacter rhodius TaxID=3004098 RepID=A0ABT4KVF6_9SPHI|nr:hypothetical protein [Pedobacter sp. SJ11]MCZ4222906.1 hypothetical protein [Pedobacter sp. SJ11]
MTDKNISQSVETSDHRNALEKGVEVFQTSGDRSFQKFDPDC